MYLLISIKYFIQVKFRTSRFTFGFTRDTNHVLLRLFDPSTASTSSMSRTCAFKITWEKHCDYMQNDFRHIIHSPFGETRLLLEAGLHWMMWTWPVWLVTGILGCFMTLLWIMSFKFRWYIYISRWAVPADWETDRTFSHSVLGSLLGSYESEKALCGCWLTVWGIVSRLPVWRTVLALCFTPSS